MPEGDAPLAPGTYQFDVPDGAGAIIDIPDGGPQIALTRRILDDTGISLCLTTLIEEHRLCLDKISGVEAQRRIDSDAADNVRMAVSTLFDKIASSARTAPPPPPTCAEPSLAADCAVLLAARDALAGDGALNWSADIPVVAQWDGVTVSGTPPRVTGLSFRYRGLTGTIPPELGNLTALRRLYLASNAFTGCIPEQLRLERTVYVDVLPTERGLDWCPVATMPSATPLNAGTYQFDAPDGFNPSQGTIIDIPEGGPQIAFTRSRLTDSRISRCLTTVIGENMLCLDGIFGLEVLRQIDSDATDDARMAVNTLFDQIAATARPAPAR